METSENFSQVEIVSNKDVIEFMRNRRSVPAKLMSGPGPDKEQLALILEIACRVPDHGKITPWRLIHFGEAKRIDLGEKILGRAIDLAKDDDRELTRQEMDIERDRFVRAPVVIGVVSSTIQHPKIPQWEQILSSAAVAMNMLIGANASGYDAQWLTEWYAYDEPLREEIGLMPGERIAGFIHIGTRLHPKTQRERPNLDDVYTFAGE